MGLPLAALLAAGIPAELRAQTTSASVSGAVQDSQGGVLPGVTVTLTSRTQGNVLTAVTDDGGRFVFPIVRPDTYTLQVTLQGFKTLERTNLVVNANDKLSTGSLTLEVGALSEEVSVTSRVTELQIDERRTLVHARKRNVEEHREQRARALQLRDAGARRAVAEHRQHGARLRSAASP